MKHSRKPVPSKRYRQLQLEVQRLLEVPEGAGRIAALSIEEELEAEFLRAWRLSIDNDGQTLEMKRMAALACRGFDHCTCYFQSQTNTHVVVTQPYLEPAAAGELLTRGLTVVDHIKPEIIPAPEWAFYYPGHATLVVVKFPPGYEKILRAVHRLWSPAAQWSLKSN